ncbi:redox-regulated ATPase YchF, partial [Candidatus Berkelbacteria bacterium]|nr:redox-regulated ATPase YchF [Candidatus Berkelbacteria bacterium]
IVLNVDETKLAGVGERMEELRSRDPSLASPTAIEPVSAKVEAELVELEPNERDEYLKELGLAEPGLNRLIRQAFELLDLATYFTAGPQEVRAWTIHRGARAPQAAGVIHTDFERGFIKAEVIAYRDYVTLGGEHGARAAGKLRLEGKDYTVTDGDVIHFRFNV